MFSTAPTLNAQLNKAHSPIRELEADQAELLTQNSALRAATTELPHDDPPYTPAAFASRTGANRGKIRPSPYV